MNSPDTLSPELVRLLNDVVADGLALYCCGRRTDPAALVASYEWKHYVDLVTIRDFDRITTARVPKSGRVDVFAPESVVWAYEGLAEHAMRALLNLVSPHHPDAPTTAYPAPVSLRVPRHEQQPMLIRPPSPGRAGVRSARLAASGRNEAHRPPGSPPADTVIGAGPAETRLVLDHVVSCARGSSDTMDNATILYSAQ